MLRGLCPKWQECPFYGPFRSLTEEEKPSAPELELLLADIRDAFAKEGGAPVANMFADKMDVKIASADLVKVLLAIEGRPWAEMGKLGLTQNKLARMLKPLEIAPKNVGPKNARVRGYILADFREAFERYLAPEGASQPPTRPQCDEIRTSDISKPHTPGNGCADVKCEKPNNDGLVGGCAVAKGGAGEMAKVTATNGGAEPGLSSRRIRELAIWCSERAYWHYSLNALAAGALDAELRAILRKEVSPERVEFEFERVMQEVRGGR
jgi:hypothetical protein